MAKFHLPTIEHEQLKKWDDRKVFARILARNQEKERPRFVFFEGPPTANGKPGIHHMLARSFKDVVLRFRTMQGFRIDRKAGWDTHGLPVELQVEKKLGFTKKQDIEDYGIAKFNDECRKSVWEYRDLWEKMTTRTAFWVDMDDAYVTYENGFIESIWSILKKVDEQGLVYKGYRVTPHCPRCVTSLSSHELAQGYKDVKDPSVFVRFAVKENERTENEGRKYFLVWTTTPWTLPGNVALAVGADVTYVEAKMKENGETLILAKERLAELEGEHEVVREFPGSELVGTAYEPIYATMPANEPNAANAHKAYAADFVSTTDGTGIVHIAPAYGEDDAVLGKTASLPTLLTVDTTGMVTVDVPGKGKFFKKADEELMADLRARGVMYKDGQVLHSYPFCWRCDTPILYYAKSSWYIRMSSLRDKLIANNAQVNWVPEHIKEGRFGEWLKDVKDWAISRERYWGTPMPIWACEACEKTRVVGSFAEMDAARKPKNRYFLQRHGKAKSNHDSVACSWPEPMECGLIEEGRDKVRESAALLKEKGITKIYASDLARTKETAEIIAAELGIEASAIVFDPRLRELDFGDLNGRSIEEFEREAAKVDRFEQQVAGTGETLWDVRRRVISFYKEIDKAHAGENILVVSHGDCLWMLATAFQGLSTQEIKDWPHYNHTGQFREMATPPNHPWNDLGELDAHRPFIDDVALACECGGTMRRVTDVMDVWFDSGAMPYAQWHYPFENAARIDTGENYPADYISEAIDQTRGWFYTLLAVSTLMGKEAPPYKNVICLGHVLDGKGQKMSKSKGNVVDPFEAVEKHGADAIRWFFFTVNQPGEPKRFDERAVDEVTKKVFMILWNVLSFWEMNAGGEKERMENERRSTSSESHVMDRWILAELDALSAKVTKEMEAYNVIDAGRAIAAFITDLSTWYVRRSRDRFKAADTRTGAAATLGHVLLSLSKLMAPFTPFAADALYAAAGGKEESVHLDAWAAGTAAPDERLRAQMEDVRRFCSLALEQRAAAGIAVRQALATATVHAGKDLEEWMKEIIAEEVNVHEVRFVESKEEVRVALDTVLTDDLKREGAARELTRQLNDLRKTSGLSVQDRIVVRYATVSAFWNATLKEYEDQLLGDVKADDLEEAATLDNGAELEVHGESISVAIEKV